jgi:flagellar hook-basal body complex protein FliE
MGAQQAAGLSPLQPSSPGAAAAGGPSFKDLLMDNLNKVSELQEDATRAVEDLQAGRRNDVETVLMATAKADTAFRMLLAVRNKMMSAFEEIKQIRV